jgi:hypothetical protein
MRSWNLGTPVDNPTLAPSGSFLTSLSGNTLTFTDSGSAWGGESFTNNDPLNPNTYTGPHVDGGNYQHTATLTLVGKKLSAQLGEGTWLGRVRRKGSRRSNHSNVDGGGGSWQANE